MAEHDLIESFALPLERHGLRYLVSGSVASMLYGEPRLTYDIDMLIFLPLGDLPRLSVAFPSPEFYLPPPEVIGAEITRGEGGQFNVIHVDSGMKADFFLATRDELQAWAFRNVVRYQVKGNTIRLAPPEYVIINKLKYYREGGSQKHIRDIRAMLMGLGDKIDRSVLNEWISRLGLETEWKFISN
jgi:hypothetical protein